jgi:hypothetical protein
MQSMFRARLFCALFTLYYVYRLRTKQIAALVQPTPSWTHPHPEPGINTLIIPPHLLLFLPQSILATTGFCAHQGFFFRIYDQQKHRRIRQGAKENQEAGRVLNTALSSMPQGPELDLFMRSATASTDVGWDYIPMLPHFEPPLCRCVALHQTRFEGCMALKYTCTERPGNKCSCVTERIRGIYEQRAMCQY